MTTEGRPKLLIVEDDLNQLDLYKIHLNGKYNLSFAQTFDEGLGLLEEKSFDAALIDITLNGSSGNGMDFLKHLKKSQKNSEIPAITVTAQALRDSREKFLAEGFDDYFAKPCNYNTLIATIDSQIQTRRGA